MWEIVSQNTRVRTAPFQATAGPPDRPTCSSAHLLGRASPRPQSPRGALLWSPSATRHEGLCEPHGCECIDHGTLRRRLRVAMLSRVLVCSLQSNDCRGRVPAGSHGQHRAGTQGVPCSVSSNSLMSVAARRHETWADAASASQRAACGREQRHGG